MKCTVCGKALVYNEIGLSKKFACGTPYCLACLAKKLNVSEARLLEKVSEFLRSGCTLFTP